MPIEQPHKTVEGKCSYTGVDMTGMTPQQVNEHLLEAYAKWSQETLCMIGCKAINEHHKKH
jgi:hypothetical protein